MGKIGWLFLVGVGCVGSTTKGGEHSSVAVGACELAAQSQTCPSCYDGPWTCTYGGTSATVGSCGECQARASLYQALCDAGNPAAADEIEAGTTCAATTCVVTYGCSCTPSCEPAAVSGEADAATATSDPCSTCPTPEDPPGPCAWDGAACAFQ